MGGRTPAALAADWLTSAIDQIALNWVSSPFAMRLEQIYGTTVYEGKVAFRPAIVNWRSGPADVDLVVPTILELGAALRSAA